MAEVSACWQCGAVLAATGVSGQATKTEPAAGASPEVNKQFVNPDVRALVARLETDSREVYAQRGAIVNALDLKPGMAVADVGAGTGVFTRLIADRVGPQGTVYAVEIAEPLLKHIVAQSKALGQKQVRPVLDEPVRPLASTGLLVGREDERDRSGGDGAGALACPHHREQHGVEVLHVDGPAAPEVAVLHLAGERVDGPVVGLGGHDVEVPVDE